MPSNQVDLQPINLIKTATVRHGGISFLGTVINGALGILYFFYLASKLSPDGFGRFSIAIGLITIGFSLFNFGFDQTLVKHKDKTDIIANIFFLKIVISLLVTLLGFLIFGWSSLFGFIGAGIGAQLLFSFSTTYLQSRNNFFGWSIILVGTNLIRLLSSIIIHSINPLNHLIIYILIPLLGFKLFYLFHIRKLPSPKFKFSEIKNLWEFNFHLSVTSILSAITSKIDAFFIAGFQSFAAAGVYSLASQLASSVSQFASAYGVVIAPKFSSQNTKVKNSNYLKKNLILSSVLGLLLIPSIFIAGFVLFTLSGKDFSKLYPLLLILLAGYSIFFASVPLRESLLYYQGDSKVFLIITSLQFLFTIIIGFVFIRPYGPIAAAISFLVAQIISVIILSSRYVIQNRRPHYS